MELPCKFSEYDYTNAGHFFPSDLAYHMNERGRERDNMMVFNILDKDGKIKYIIWYLQWQYIMITVNLFMQYTCMYEI